MVTIFLSGLGSSPLTARIIPAEVSLQETECLSTTNLLHVQICFLHKHDLNN